jgi:hypothetical protein
MMIVVITTGGIHEIKGATVREKSGGKEQEAIIEKVRETTAIIGALEEMIIEIKGIII